MVQNVISLSAMVVLFSNDQYTDKIAVLLACPRKTLNSDTRSISMTSPFMNYGYFSGRSYAALRLGFLPPRSS